MATTSGALAALSGPLGARLGEGPGTERAGLGALEAELMAVAVVSGPFDICVELFPHPARMQIERIERRYIGIPSPRPRRYL